MGTGICARSSLRSCPACSGCVASKIQDGLPDASLCCARPAGRWTAGLHEQWRSGRSSVQETHSSGPLRRLYRCQRQAQGCNPGAWRSLCWPSWPSWPRLSRIPDPRDPVSRSLCPLGSARGRTSASPQDTAHSPQPTGHRTQTRYQQMQTRQARWGSAWRKACRALDALERTERRERRSVAGLYVRAVLCCGRDLAAYAQQLCNQNSTE